MKKILLLLALLSGAALATLSTTSTTVTCAAGTTCVVPFKFLDATHLVVTVNGVVKTLGTHYSVTGAGSNSGGRVTFTSAQAYPIIVTRVLPLTQPTGLRSQTTFNPVTHENALDRLAMQIQQLNAGLITPTTSWAGLTGSTDRFVDVYNIRDYGAVCDGTTSDLSAIRATVVAAVADGKAVYVPPSANGCVIPTGSDVDGDIVQITGPVSIFGSGPASTIYIKGSSWRGAAGTGGYFDVREGSVSTTSITFENLRFLGDYPVGTSGPATGRAAIQMGNNADLTVVTSNTRVIGVTFEKLGGPGVQYGGGDWNPSNCCMATGHVVANSNFINSGSLNDQVNAFSDGVRGVIIANNHFRDTRSTAVEMAGMEHQVIGNTFTNVYGYGVYTTGRVPTGEGTRIANNTFANVGTDVAASASRPCIQISQGTGSQRTMVTGNQIHNCAAHGIYAASGVTDLTISGNYVDCSGYGSTGAGIYVGAGAVRGKVTDNFVRACASGGTSNYGVLISGGNTDFWVDGNTTMGTFSGASFILGAALGAEAVAGGTRDYIGKNNFNLTTGQWANPTDYVNADSFPILAAGSATPSVAGWDVWRSTNTNPTTITNFTGGRLGQVLTVVFRDTNTTLTHGTNILLRGKATKTYGSSDVIQLVKDYSNWREIGYDASADLTTNVKLAPAAAQTDAAVSLASGATYPAISATSTAESLAAVAAAGYSYLGPFSGGTPHYGGHGLTGSGGVGWYGTDASCASGAMYGGMGVYGTGGTYGGPGGYFVGSSSGCAGPGVYAQGSPALRGVAAQWNPTRGVINIDASITSTPSAPSNGDMWISTSGTQPYLFARINGTTYYVVMATSTKPY